MAFSLDELTEDIAGGRKGKGMNKGKLIIVGVILIGVYVLVFKRRTAPPIEAETIPDIELAGYPQMNPADLNDAFANYSSVVLGEVGSSLDDFQTDIMDIITENNDEQNKYIDDIKAGLEKQLGTDPQTVEKKNSAAWTIGYGLHGEGNPNAGVDFSKDRSKLKEEVDRTLSVISYRESQGLDITAQNTHLSNLRKL